ncbi:MAG: tetratricopeptide repeat protein [Ruminococcus flavefaciens]|nr:tetratricopeptide repeat protein [Ruminococcus flavefaciens]MCM1059998.1 tetratricopeptide repeat protein [Eubacterium sp.]
MRFFPFIPTSVKRILICIIRAVPKAFAIEGAAALLLFIFSSFYFNGGAVSYSEASESLIMIFFVIWLIFFIEQLRRYSSNFFHRYDDELIGKAFTGLNRKSLLFEKGLECFAQKEFRIALEIFTDLEDEKYRKTQQEYGVISFYRGRCYDILQAYPNALMCYEKAIENNFYYDGLPLLIARANFENGETQRAVDMYQELLDSERENRYERIVRTSLGHIYLKTGDSETALKWFQDAIDRHENYAEALAGAAIAQVNLHNFEEGDKLYRLALINNIENSENFTNYYKEIQAAALLESDYTIAK